VNPFPSPSPPETELSIQQVGLIINAVSRYGRARDWAGLDRRLVSLIPRLPNFCSSEIVAWCRASYPMSQHLPSYSRLLAAARAVLAPRHPGRNLLTGLRVPAP